MDGGGSRLRPGESHEGGLDPDGLNERDATMGILDYWGAALSHLAPPRCGNCRRREMVRSTSPFAATGAGPDVLESACIGPARSCLRQ